MAPPPGNPPDLPDLTHHADEPRHALRYLRAHTVGSLHFDALILARAVVLDPATGDPVTPVPPAVLSAQHLVLYLPEESGDALQLLVEPVALNPDTDAACDRWLIYHGAPRDPRWARLQIQSARLGPAVFDADDLRIPNPLRADEPRLCALLNADARALGELCSRSTGVSPADPRAVGVDPDGIDIRARFGIIRVELDRPIDPASAESTLRALLQGPGA